MKIAVIGTGYVGLVTGTCFAESGNDVICVDVDEAKIAALQGGEIPIYEPGLSEMVSRNQSQGRLRFTSDIKLAVQESLLIFLAVGTPTARDGSTNMAYVEEAVAAIGSLMDGYRIIVNKSTVPVGTGIRVTEILSECSAHPFDVVSNPEFLKEGNAIDDFMKPDRVVVGTDSPDVAKLFRNLYAPFTRTGASILITDSASAELTKYAANAMLATRISFMNEIANLCELVGADVNQVRKGMSLDKRIGKAFLFPGLGYGGSCFPKDVLALLQMGQEVRHPMRILEAVDLVNRSQPLRFIDGIVRRLGRDLNGVRFGLWGLAFKPQTDDMREAPSRVLIRELARLGAQLRVYDPAAMRAAQSLVPEPVEYATDPYHAIEGADALILATEWNQFRRPDFQRMLQIMKRPVIFDGRNQYSQEEMKSLGFDYYSVGRAPVNQDDCV